MWSRVRHACLAPPVSCPSARSRHTPAETGAVGVSRGVAPSKARLSGEFQGRWLGDSGPEVNDNCVVRERESVPSTRRLPVLVTKQYNHEIWWDSVETGQIVRR